MIFKSELKKISLNEKAIRQKDAEAFADILRKANLSGVGLCIDKKTLPIHKGTKHVIQYNHEDFELLKHDHEYTIPLKQGILEVSLQLYENETGHYRLFCYVFCNGSRGMTFSLNLTTEKESKNVIYLTQKIKFAENYEGLETEKAKAIRRQKQSNMVSVLLDLGLEVTETNDLILGIFDPQNGCLLNTTTNKFLNDFLAVAIIKGHFQGNKGYSLEELSDLFESQKVNSIMPTLRSKTRNRLESRVIPLSLRYDVLVRDNHTCVSCGRKPEDGVVLHVDHKTPFSLGGLTKLDNLQILCMECNLGKSNRYID